MKRILFILTFFGMLFGGLVRAQNTHFTTEGVIEFEKKINMYAVIKKYITDQNQSYMQQAFDQFKKTQPQFKTVKSTYAFNRDRSLYTPIEEAVAPNSFSADPTAGQPNTIYTDLASGKSICQKKVFEETFLVKDSLRRINWKITDEKRDILGYSCRRANAIILDSIYVVAFYTEEIPLSGGPESFNGLPGMILGVALPHENITWFATKITEKTVDGNALKPPVKGKPTDNKGLKTTILAALKDWGKYAQTALKVFLL